MKYLVVGSPVSHSLSPVMMNAAFRAAGIGARYEAREVPRERWPQAMRELWAEGVQGVNVTVPHKEEAVSEAWRASDAARAIGAANTLVRESEGWLAENTDAPGFLGWLEELGKSELLSRDAMVLGAGGAARAVVWALMSAGCPRILVANRTPSRADALMRGRGMRVVAVRWGAPAPAGGLVVNCTSLGLGEADPTPLDGKRLRSAGFALDLVYPETPWVRSARAQGVPAESGEGLLISQGALSFECWTGIVPDRKLMRAAVREEIERRAKA